MAMDEKQLKVAMTSPLGLLFVAMLVLESIVGAYLLGVAEGTGERVFAGLLFAGMFAAILRVFFLLYPIAPGRVDVVPGSMLTPAIPAAEAQAKANLFTAPDATFAYSKPPANWTTRSQPFFALMAQQLAAQAVASPAPLGADNFPFRPGEVVVFEEKTKRTIEYLPGTRINGRVRLALLPDSFVEHVWMFSVSVHGMTIERMTAEHVFSLLVSFFVFGGASVQKISEAVGEGDTGTMITARSINSCDKVVVDGAGPTSAVVENRLHVIEKNEIIYVMMALVVSGLPTSPARGREVDDIIRSFQATIPSDITERRRRDGAEAEASYNKVVAGLAPSVFVMKARNILVAALREDQTPQGLAQLMVQCRALEESAAPFSSSLPAEVAALLDEIEPACREAVTGDVTRARHVLAILDGEETGDPGAPSEPTLLPQPSPSLPDEHEAN